MHLTSLLCLLGLSDGSKFKLIQTLNTNCTVQQIETQNLSRYVGLVESDERWKTVYLVWRYQVKFSGYPDF
jgi:hypothetical protein